MKLLLALPLLTALILTGCARKHEPPLKPVPASTGAASSKSPAAPSKPKRSAADSPGLIVTPSGGLTGKVSSYNEAGRFVVLEFPVGHLPSLEQRMFVYRGGLKVGEVKVTGPQKDDHIVADLSSGEAQAGDEVRDK